MGQRDEKEKQKTRREKQAGYFLDMSKLTFGTTVLASITPPYDAYGLVKAALAVVGVAATVVFYTVGSKILKD